MKVPDLVEVTCLEIAKPEGLWSKGKLSDSFLFPQRALILLMLCNISPDSNSDHH